MTTYSKSQIIDILKEAPDGAQYYTDGYDVKYRKVLGDKYFGYLDEAKGWVETCDKELSQERIDKGWWMFNLAKQLGIPKETPEEKEVLNGIESIESVGEVEWKNGDECLSSTGYTFTFIGLCDSNGFDCILLSESGVPTFGFTKELSKPETPQQREERERLEAAEDLYYAYMIHWDFKPEWEVLDETNRNAFLTIVDKTKYRKEKTHGAN